MQSGTGGFAYMGTAGFVCVIHDTSRYRYITRDDGIVEHTLSAAAGVLHHHTTCSSSSSRERESIVCVMCGGGLVVIRFVMLMRWRDHSHKVLYSTLGCSYNKYEL
jgi:hypothetical protein